MGNLSNICDPGIPDLQSVLGLTIAVGSCIRFGAFLFEVSRIEFLAAKLGGANSPRFRLCDRLGKPLSWEACRFYWPNNALKDAWAVYPKRAGFGGSCRSPFWKMLDLAFPYAKVCAKYSTSYIQFT